MTLVTTGVDQMVFDVSQGSVNIRETLGMYPGDDDSQEVPDI